MPPSTREKTAATYIRMSTEKQVYSVANQRTAIAAYALDRGYAVVRDYVDEGKSGLTIKHRPALKQLLTDVVAGDSDFDAVLVYDISRWGRFQDTDESAHYEFLCRSAGVQVHYCAEVFENDGSFTTAIMKSLKRVMAGEYSRELSRKVLHAQKRLAATGMKMGGRPCYGYRRMLVDAAGNPKGLLNPSQVKAIRSDRVILVPGPAEEVKTVRRIYNLFVRRRYNDRQIADKLNSDGIKAANGADWAPCSVRYILTSERYIGTLVFNKSSHSLQRERTVNPRDAWIRSDNAHEALVDRKTFEQAQRLRTTYGRRQTNKELIEHLKELYQRHGWLSWAIIDRSPLTPSAQTYAARFGSLEAAYEHVGFEGDQLSYCSVGRSLRPKLVRFVQQVRKSIERSGGSVDQSPESRLLVVDGRTIIGATLISCIQGTRESYWRVKRDPAVDLDFVLVGAMSADARTRQALYLLPVERFPFSNRIYLVNGGSRMEPYRVGGLNELYEKLRPDTCADRSRGTTA